MLRHKIERRSAAAPASPIRREQKAAHLFWLDGWLRCALVEDGSPGSHVLLLLLLPRRLAARGEQQQQICGCPAEKNKGEKVKKYKQQGTLY